MKRARIELWSWRIGTCAMLLGVLIGQSRAGSPPSEGQANSPAMRWQEQLDAEMKSARPPRVDVCPIPQGGCALIIDATGKGWIVRPDGKEDQLTPVLGPAAAKSGEVLR